MKEAPAVFEFPQSPVFTGTFLFLHIHSVDFTFEMSGFENLLSVMRPVSELYSSGGRQGSTTSTSFYGVPAGETLGKRKRLDPAELLDVHDALRPVGTVRTLQYDYSMCALTLHFITAIENTNS